MQTIQTDDAARRQEFSWKGTVELPLITEVRMPALAAGFALVPLFAFLGWVLTPFIEWLPWDPRPLGIIARFVIGAGGAAALAIVLIRRVGKHITPTRPVRYHRANLAYEMQTPRVDTAEVTVETTPDPGLWLEHSGTDRATTALTAPSFLGEAAEDHHND